MSDWALSACERQEFSTAAVSRGAANAKGAYAQLIAATGFAYSAVTLQISSAVSSGGGQTYLVDIAIGAGGAEQVIVPNILLDTARAQYGNSVDIALPVSIPAGSRISACCQEAGGAGTRNVQVSCIGRSGGANYWQASAGPVSAYGILTTLTNGVLVDQGAVASAYGAWTEITAATSAAHNGLVVVLGTDKTTVTIADQAIGVQLAVGAATAEVLVAEWSTACNSATNRLNINTFDLFMQIPTGTRLSMATKSNIVTAAARHITATILGY